MDHSTGENIKLKQSEGKKISAREIARLPGGYHYGFSFKNGVIIIKVDGISTEEEANNWLKQYKHVTKTAWRVLKTVKPKTASVLFRKQFRCFYKRRSSSQKVVSMPNSKHTNCPCWMKLSICKKDSKKKIANDLMLKVEIHYKHNHSLDSTGALQARDVNDDSRDKLQELFRSGYGSIEALNVLRFSFHFDLSDEDNSKILEDRSVIPDIGYVRRLQAKTGHKAFNVSISAWDNVSTVLQKLNTTLSAMDTVKEEVIVTVVSPLMQRAHTLRESSDIVHLQSAGNYDTSTNRVFLLMIASKVGGIPIGAFFTTSRKPEIVSQGLSRLSSLLGSSAFNGQQYPVYCVVDDDDGDAASAVRSTWPATTVLLCSCKLAQATWKWLRDEKPEIPVEKRQHLMAFFIEMIYAKQHENLLDLYNSMISDAEVPVKFKAYLNKLWNQRQKWAHAYRPVNFKHHTNNIIESTFSILRRCILLRHRAFNMALLIEFICVRLEEYLRAQVTAAAQGLTKKPICLPNNLIKTGVHLYKMDTHIMHSDIQLCQTCIGYCPFIGKVVQIHGLLEQQNLSSDEKASFHCLANGKVTVPQNDSDCENNFERTSNSEIFSAIREIKPEVCPVVGYYSDNSPVAGHNSDNSSVAMNETIAVAAVGAVSLLTDIFKTEQMDGLLSDVHSSDLLLGVNNPNNNYSDIKKQQFLDELRGKLFSFNSPGIDKAVDVQLQRIAAISSAAELEGYLMTARNIIIPRQIRCQATSSGSQVTVCVKTVRPATQRRT